MKGIRINQGRSVPLLVRLVVSFVVILVSIQILAHLPENAAIALTMSVSLILPVLWFSFDVLTIDTASRRVHQGIWIMGRPIGRSKAYTKIENIFIEKPQTEQNGRNSTHQPPLYRAFITFDNQKKYYILSGRSEESLKKKLSKIKKRLEFME
ncbi:MAG: hypothetical protein AAF551_06585 [Bacteroidota bacterium]